MSSSTDVHKQILELVKIAANETIIYEETIELQARTIKELGKRADMLRRERDAFIAAGKAIERRAEEAEAKVAEIEEALNDATEYIRSLKGMEPIFEENPKEARTCPF